MSTYLLVHGAAHGGWCWDEVAAALTARGQTAVAPDLPITVPGVGAEASADVLIEALSETDDDVVAVAHSASGLVLPVLATRQPLRRMVFVAAAIPSPGISIGELMATEPGAVTFPLLSEPMDEAGRVNFSWETVRTYFYHDLPEEQARAAWLRLRPQDLTLLLEPCPIPRWPDVPSTYVAMTDDRAMDPAVWQRVAAERLGADLLELPGGHAPFLSRPAVLAEALASLSEYESHGSGLSPGSRLARGR